MIIIDSKGFWIEPWKENFLGIPLKEATRYQAGVIWISSFISAVFGTPLIIWVALLDLVVEFVVAIGIVQRRKRFLKWYTFNHLGSLTRPCCGIRGGHRNSTKKKTIFEVVPYLASPPWHGPCYGWNYTIWRGAFK